MDQAKSITLEKFLEGLSEIPAEEFSVKRVADYLRWKQIEKQSFQSFVYFDKDHYTRNLVYKNDLYEVIAFGWDIGQKAPIHSHNRQLCWMTVQEGKLGVTNYRLDRCDIDLSKLKVQECTPQDSVALTKTAEFIMPNVGVITWADEKKEIHSVENSPAFGQRAISVHIYSRPFDSCIVYDLGEKRCQRIKLSYSSVRGKRIQN